MTTQACIERRTARTPCHAKSQTTYRPATDIRETENDVRLHIDMPGVGRDDVTLTVEQETLTVSAQRKQQIDGSPVYREARSGRYHRVFTLSDGLDTDQIRADMKDGVLRIHIPKAAKVKPRRIDIDVV